MDREKIILYIWKCLVIVFISSHFAELIYNTAITWKITDGTTLEFDGAGFTEMIMVCACYYTTKWLISKEYMKDEDK